MDKQSTQSDNMTIESHLKFDAHKARANKAVLAAREHQAALWAELAQPSPSLLKMDEIGSAIEKHLIDANTAFERMLRLNPNSVSGIRMYAQFLDEVSISRLCATRLTAPLACSSDLSKLCFLLLWLQPGDEQWRQSGTADATSGRPRGGNCKGVHGEERQCGHVSTGHFLGCIP